MKKICFLLGFLVLLIGADAQVRIDLSTGVTGDFSGVLTPFGAFDDSWGVKFPNTNTFVNIPVCTGVLQQGNVVSPGVWLSQACARWLSPQIFANGNSMFTTSGDFVYRTGFWGTANVCNLGPQHRIHFDWIGSDNSITNIKFNNTNYAIAPVPTFNPLSSNIDILLNSSDFVNGLNTIEITVNNVDRWNGLFICGYLEYFPNISMSSINITGPTNFCYDDPITVSSSIAGNAQSHMWTITQCDASGNTIAGGYNFSTAPINGNPSSYTFPGPNVLPCNNYYKVKLYCTGGCPLQTLVKTQIICVSCNNPSFSLSNNTSNSAYYTMAALPNVIAPYGPCGNFGYAWYVEELVGSTSVFMINNPPSWWTFTANNVNYINKFAGMDCTISGNYSGTVNTLPAAPSLGKFLYGRTYRITRGTWVSTGVCGWKQQSQTITVSPVGAGLIAGGAPHYITEIHEDFDAPDFSGLINMNSETASIPVVDNSLLKITISPNPNFGEFLVSLQSAVAATPNLYIVDLSGRILHTQTINIQDGLTQIPISKTELPAGIYFIKIDGIDETVKVVITK